LQARGRIPFASTFAAFWTRAHDFIRMAAISRAERVVGSHTGVTVGEDGPSQMALEDIAMFRAIHDCTVLAASDANQTAALVEAMLDRPGVVYLRTLRMPTPVVSAPGESFSIGGSHTLRSAQHDHVALLAAGVTVHESLAAADILAKHKIDARVIDLYSIKPLDAAAVVDAVRQTGNIIVAEDHWAQGGLGDAVLETLADAESGARVRRLAVHGVPTSVRPEELLWHAGIDSTWIATAARDLLEQPLTTNGHRTHSLRRAYRA
jgi:transketolase